MDAYFTSLSQQSYCGRIVPAVGGAVGIGFNQQLAGQATTVSLSQVASLFQVVKGKLAVFLATNPKCIEKAKLIAAQPVTIVVTSGLEVTKTLVVVLPYTHKKVCQLITGCVEHNKHDIQKKWVLVNRRVSQV